MHYLSYCSATFCSFLLISCSCLHLFLCGFVFVLSCLVFSFYFCSPLCFIYLFQMQEFWSTGVLTAKTRCWAQGMDGWRPLQAIPQLKWCLLATGQAVMNESDLATLILNMLITMCSYYPSRWDPLKLSLLLCERQINHLSSFTSLFYVLYTVGFINCFSLLRDQDNAIIRPLPKIKRMIADNACLPHIVQVVAQFVLKLCHMTRWYSSLNWIKCLLFIACLCPLQLLLTFDPILVEKVANVLYLVMQDNPNLQRLYLTGVFFFIMMYTGSNVLPVARWKHGTVSWQNLF